MTELIEKSGEATGARTDGVPVIVTTTSDEWETTPFDAVTIKVYVPVDGELPAVSVRVEDALPSAGSVTGLGKLTETPSGATPLQAAERPTEELNPSTDANTIVVDFDTSGVKVMTAGEG